MADKSPTNEQSKQNSEENIIAGIPAEAFDAQVLLLDAFIGNLKASNVVIHNDPTVQDYAANVPYSEPSAETINALTFSDERSVERVQNYVDNITSADLAQMVPDIVLEIVDGTSYKTIFYVPLTDPGNITTGFSGPGYYSTQTVGLKSLELFLDGSDNPFFGTVYNVSMQLMFDSVNTFFQKAPGSDLTYAQIFRSSGKVASGDYFTRLTLGMTSDNDAVSVQPPLLPSSVTNKYGLDDPVMTLSLNLQLVKTNIKIDPNLKTTITVDYISQEEAMFNSQEIFDFLGLDLEEAQKSLKKEVGDARQKKAILEQAAKLRQQEKIDQNARDIKLFEDYIAEASSNIKKSKYVINGVKGDYNGSTERLDYIKSENKKIKEWREGIKKAKKDIEEKKKQDAIEEFKKEYGAKSFKDIEEKIESAQNKFSNVRVDQIVAAIDAIINDPDLYIGNSPAIRTIKISKEELRDYYLQGTSVGFDNVKTKQLGVQPKNAGKPFNSRTNPNTKTREDAKKDIADRNTANLQAFFKRSQKPNEDGTVDFRGFSGSRAGSAMSNTASVDAIVAGLSEQKHIQYILLGDFLRLLFKRLYNIRTSKTVESFLSFTGRGTSYNKQMQYTAILNKTMVLLSKIRFKNMENSTGDIVQDIYSIPISITHITHIIAKSTFGKSKNFFTIFEMVQKIVDLISNSRRRKANILNIIDYAGGFAISKRTYAMTTDRDAGVIRVAGKRDFPENTLHGIVFHAKRVKETTSETELKPTFIFGGVDRGIVRGFGIESLQDDAFAKMIDEELQNSASRKDNIIPLMFKCQLETLPAFFFQLGSIFSVVAPSLDVRNSQFFLEGDYRVMSVKHSYQAGSTFRTSISGYMDSTNTSKEKSGKPEKTQEEQRRIINEGAINKLKQIKQKFKNPAGEDLTELGFNEKEITRLKNSLAQPQGHPIRKAAEAKIRKRMRDPSSGSRRTEVVDNGR